MNNLDPQSLSIIFNKLSVKDIVSCSRVCRRWHDVYEMSRKKNLFLIYGVDFPGEELTCHEEPSNQSLVKSINPNYIHDNSILEFKNNMVMFIETFIYHGNKLLDVPSTFSLHLFPILKYVEIIDENFCQTIQRNFILSLKKEKSNPEKQYKRFGRSIKTLKVSEINFNLLLLGLPNLENLSVLTLTFGLDYSESIIKHKTSKWKSATIRSVEFVFGKPSPKPIIFNYLLNNCPDLESISVFIKNVRDFNRLMSNFKLKHICIGINDVNINQTFIEYGKIIYNYEPRLNKECTLCISNKSVKSLKDFNSMSEIVSKINKKIGESKTHRFCYDKLYLKVFGNLDTQILKRSNITESIQYVSLNSKDNIEINFKEIFKALPKTLIKLKVKSENLIPDSTLDLIPNSFPSLKQFIFIIKKSEIKKLSFISKLKLLNLFKLSVLRLDFDELAKEFEKLYFLNFIHLNMEEKFSENDINKLKSIFMKRKLSSTFKFDIYFNSLLYKNFNRNNILQD